MKKSDARYKITDTGFNIDELAESNFQDHVRYPVFAVKYFFIVILFFLFTPSFLYSQDVDIVPYLKQIESGDKDEVEKILPDLKKTYPNNPSVMFLEGVLTTNGQDAVAIYSKIINSYPGSKYADASLYRIYSYYYTLGLYEAAKNHLGRLKKEYPESPYIKISDKNIPSEDEITFADKKPVETSEANYKYTIQAGAFGKLQNAQALQKNFIDSGFKSRIKEKNVGGTGFHIVYVGEYHSEDEAKNFLQVINKEYKLDGRVIRIEE